MKNDANNKNCEMIRDISNKFLQVVDTNDILIFSIFDNGRCKLNECLTTQKAKL